MGEESVWEVTPEARIAQAVTLIAQVPGYTPVAQDLATRPIYFVPTLKDRGEARLNGSILIGPEALEGSLVGLAETLVHEQFHTQQSPFAKTPSFWLGVFTRTPLMARYERPAYRAALRFLEQVALALPEHAADALREAEAVRLAYTILYKLPLDER